MKRGVLITAILALGACGNGQEVPLPAMVAIPAGTFVMGAPDDADAQQGKPQHQVTLGAFRLAQTPVTFAQYDAFAAATGHPLPQDDGLGRGTMPVINLTRADMLAYIAWLNRVDASGGYRLPSEAEWEYAARAGTTSSFYWGEDPSSDHANIRDMAGRDQWQFTSPVASFPANPWGLYDMAGNVWEMTADCRTPGYANALPDGSPQVTDECTSHMVRGGDYSSSRRGQRPTARAAAGDTFRSGSLGVRVAQSPPRD
jgi:formylglycine-generating enzyme required for sulfatase activity